MQLRLSEKIPWAFALALLPLVIIVIASFRSMTGLLEAANWVRHTHEVEIQLAQLLSHITDAETGLRGFVITGRENFLEPYHKAVGVIDKDLAAMQRLTADNAEQMSRLDAIKPIIADKLTEMKGTIARRRADGFAAAHSIRRCESSAERRWLCGTTAFVRLKLKGQPQRSAILCSAQSTSTRIQRRRVRWR